jgi:hypothetical protein
MKNPSLFRRLGALVLPVVVSLAALTYSLAACGSAKDEQLPDIVPWQPPKVSLEGIPLAASEPDPDGVQFAGVGMAEDGAMIIVNFVGPAALIQTWNQGDVYVVDQNGTAYNQVPVAPVLGPLFAKPKEDGQAGYVLLYNPNYGVRPGSIVSVVLGKYRRDHIQVR